MKVSSERDVFVGCIGIRISMATCGLDLGSRDCSEYTVNVSSLDFLISGLSGFIILPPFSFAFGSWYDMILCRVLTMGDQYSGCDN